MKAQIETAKKVAAALLRIASSSQARRMLEQHVKEARALTFGDVRLDGPEPHVVHRSTQRQSVER